MNDVETVARRQKVRLRPSSRFYGRGVGRGSGRRGIRSSRRFSSFIALGCVMLFFVLTVMLLASRLEAPRPLRAARTVAPLESVTSEKEQDFVKKASVLKELLQRRQGIVPLSEKLLSNCSKPETWLSGIDLRGGDIQNVPLKMNAEECCNACAARSQCAAWTAVENDGSCWLKGRLGRRIAAKSMTSGLLRNAIQIEAVPEVPQAVMPREARKKQSVRPHCRHTSKDELRLFYKAAARDWSEAFPLGNGKLGALVGLEPWSGRVAIAEETLFERRSDIEEAKAKRQAREATERAARAEKNKSTADDKKWLSKPATPFEAFQISRNALLNGNIKAAQEAARWLDAGPVPSFEGLATLNFEVSPSLSEVLNYERSLNLEAAVASARFQATNNTIVNYKREAFVSAADNVLVLRFECYPIDCRVEISMQRLERAISSKPSQQHLVISDDPKGKGLGFAACARLLNTTRQEKDSKNKLTAIGSSTTFLITGVTSYTSETPVLSCLEKLDAAAMYNYVELRQRHIQDFTSAFGFTRLSLRESARFVPSSRQDIDTEILDTGVRVAELGEECVWQNKSKYLIMDPSLIALSYNYARYLLVSSSRENSVAPANLQGVWADGLKAPWAGDFHLNINLEMAYWAAGGAGLGQISTPPLFDLLNRLAESGRQVAQEYYGIPRGWVAHGFTDISADARPLGENRWALCVTCGAWIAITVYELTEFEPSNCTNLKSLIKHLQGSVEFFLSGYLIKINNTLITTPTTSPENSYRSTIRNKNASRYIWSTLARAPAIDNAILYRLFQVYEEACARLNDNCDISNYCDSELVTKAILAKSQLPNHGQPQYCAHQQNMTTTLREYPFDGDEESQCLADAGHRHFSGLWALMPGRQISPLDNEDIASAAATTLNIKMMNKGGHTGWSRAWAAALAARLHDGLQTQTHLVYLIRNFFTTNLLATHPPLKPIDAFQRQGCTTCFEADFQSSRPISTAKRKSNIRLSEGMITSSKDVFQLDANLGLAAAVHEALAQSHRGPVNSIELHLLPALPPSWTHGHIIGMRIRGGFQLDLHWAHSMLSNISIRALDKFSHTLTIRTSPSNTQFVSNSIENFTGHLILLPSSTFSSSPPMLSYPQPHLTRVENFKPNFILDLGPSPK
uniref:Apple domain-containing protein n=1 Tax=Aureoumbra lagunensis TaxID=44058 RepID=A0A7S3JVL2_9STRA|mmetsp:Transcript_8038/g.12264  ORF Transcript_8038/g.12264 Transcript_8038/m.12264 type:complete len:1142 (+) Transcript_8038:141-3566(+)